MELLIRIVDKQQKDEKLAPLASKAGDVIAICPDGWQWSKREQENPDWRIVKSPILAVEKEALLAPKVVKDVLTARRATRIDIAAITALADSAKTSRDSKQILEVARTTLTAAAVAVK